MPNHQQALISLLLARTDQFDSDVHVKAAPEVLAQIKGDYQRAYYQGMIWERLGNARIAMPALEPAHPHITRCGKQWITMRRP